jgi:small subunit ribosomal protein S3
MGQKVSPVGLRIGVNKDWGSKWFASKQDYATYLHEDIKIRELISNTPKFKDAVVSKVEIEKTKDSVTVNVSALKPAVILGQDGNDVKALSKKIAKIAHGKNVKINVKEVSNPDLDATVIAKWIAEQLENRASFRTVQKKAIQRVMKAGAKGIKTSVSGRLGGADIARSEGYSEGVVPLHTIRADIDYANSEAATTYGKLGVKVWICRGEILPTKKSANAEEKGE